MSDYETIDQAGDVIVVHNPSTEPFAPWPEVRGETIAKTERHEPEQFKALVSSNVLRLVSPVFQIMLDGQWAESQVQADGSRHLSLTGFDSMALKHLLNVFHHKTRLIPEVLDVEMLAKMAVIIDYLQCHDAVALVAETWSKSYKGLPKEQFSRELVLWLFVSTVFKLPHIFDSAAVMAVQHCKAPFNTLGLPIAQNVVRE